MNLNSSGRTQRGMVLVICLIMLLLLTLSGLAAMRGSTLQEKMAGNSRDSEQAFLAAESALRNGELFMTTAAAVASGAFNTTGSTGLYDVATSGVPVDWQSASTNWRNSASLTGVAATPKYLVERLPEITNKGLSLEADQPLSTMIIYRVTASAVGQTTTSRAVLQSTFRR